MKAISRHRKHLSAVICALILMVHFSSPLIAGHSGFATTNTHTTTLLVEVSHGMTDYSLPACFELSDDDAINTFDERGCWHAEKMFTPLDDSKAALGGQCKSFPEWFQSSISPHAP